MDAERIAEVFGPGEVGRIYLNFSDPWPKDRHAGRRLPSGIFLARFALILEKGGKLEFKTDNQALFDFALEELEPIFLGEVPLSLEETFIAEMEGAGYDIRKVLQ